VIILINLMKHTWSFILFLSFITISFTGCQSYARDYEQFSSEEKMVIRFSHVVGEDTPKGLAARKFAQLVKEKSNGRIEVQVFANGSLYRDGEEWDALQQGDIQMIAPATAKMTSKIPELQIFDLPFFFSNMDQIHHLTDGEIGKSIFQAAKKYHVEPLAIWDNGFKQLTNRYYSLHTPKDFEGLTFRIMPSPILAEQFTMLGAKAEAKNFNDVYHALVNREIDGQENTISNIYTKKFHEAQNYLILSNHGYLGYLVMMNQDFWNKLSPEYQEIITEAMAEVTEWQRVVAEDLQEQQLTLIERCDCIKIEPLTEEEWKRFHRFYQPLHKKLEQRLGTSFIDEIHAIYLQ